MRAHSARPYSQRVGRALSGSSPRATTASATRGTKQFRNQVRVRSGFSRAAVIAWPTSEVNHSEEEAGPNPCNENTVHRRAFRYAEMDANDRSSSERVSG